MSILDVFSKKKEPMQLPPPPMPELDDEQMELPELPMDVEPMDVPAEMPVHEEDSAVEPPSLPELRQHLPREGPLFVSVQDYQMILNGVTAIKAKLSMTDESFKKLHDIKAAQEKQLDAWRQSLEDVQRKLTYVDEVLFGR
jgi:hypothetical protein